MKHFFLGIIFLSFGISTQAEFTDITNGSVIYSAITCPTNDASTKDLQDALGIYPYHFNVHRSSLTNGVSVYVEIRINGKPTKTVCESRADFDILNNQQIGEDVPVFVSMNPVGSMDGEGIISARKLHFFVRLAGISSTAHVVDNPFYNSKDGVATWRCASKESPTVFKLMDCLSGTNRSGPKTEITVRFYEW